MPWLSKASLECLLQTLMTLSLLNGFSLIISEHVHILAFQGRCFILSSSIQGSIEGLNESCEIGSWSCLHEPTSRLILFLILKLRISLNQLVLVTAFKFIEVISTESKTLFLIT